METTTKLNLQISTADTFTDDDIKQTINAYGDNFIKLESTIADSTTHIEGFTVGASYPYAKRIWDATPLANGHIGWVNLRTGIYAPEWHWNYNYALGDLVRALPDNGNVYECIVDGRSMMNTPSFLTNPNIEFYDASGSQWVAEYNYQVDDVTFATDGSLIYYFICETAGLSSTVEPDWNAVSVGTTVIDGSVVWRKEKTVKWKQVNVSCNFRPFGKIE